MRFKVGENVGEGSTSVNEDASVYDKRKKLVDNMLSELGAKVIKEDQLTPYSFRYEMQFNDDLMEFSKRIETLSSFKLCISSGLIFLDLCNLRVLLKSNRISESNLLNESVSESYITNCLNLKL